MVECECTLLAWLQDCVSLPPTVSSTNNDAFTADNWTAFSLLIRRCLNLEVPYSIPMPKLRITPHENRDTTVSWDSDDEDIDGTDGTRQREQDPHAKAHDGTLHLSLLMCGASTLVYRHNRSELYAAFERAIVLQHRCMACQKQLWIEYIRCRCSIAWPTQAIAREEWWETTNIITSCLHTVDPYSNVRFQNVCGDEMAVYTSMHTGAPADFSFHDTIAQIGMHVSQGDRVWSWTYGYNQSDSALDSCFYSKYPLLFLLLLCCSLLFLFNAGVYCQHFLFRLH